MQCQLCMKYCPDFALEVVPRPKVRRSPTKEQEIKSTPAGEISSKSVLSTTREGSRQ
ncbi:MAG: hypothetical protein DRI99_01320 [Candidatus Aminicenantes bacterium]|nr:MAG: hypothetical protein DRI99_01320 [Candidatus Aminicenantes bacterium]